LAVYALAAGISRLSKKINRHTHIPCGICAAVVLSLLLLCIGACGFFALKQLLYEVKKVLVYVSADGLDTLLERLEQIPLIATLVSGREQYAQAQITPIISKLLTPFANTVSAVLSHMVRATPTAMLTGAVSIIACYYMSVDFDRITALLLRFFPPSVRHGIVRARKGVVGALVGYVRGYALLFLITFFEVLVGLLILCPSYAWLWAFFIAAIDVIPAVGTGIILIPWGLISLFGGEYFVGVGLLLLYVIVTVVRQIAEPHILGARLGLHPLASIISMYVGFRLFGALGIIVAPLVMTLAVRLLTDKKTA
jgi:sporulation integral membrane protein YtvI